jgi:hypothetical protein
MYSVRDDAKCAGLPHSDIPGSKVAPTSPGLFAECHVLHRLSMPRHPPNALLILESSSSCAGMKSDDITPTHNAQLYPSGKTLPANLCFAPQLPGAALRPLGYGERSPARGRACLDPSMGLGKLFRTNFRYKIKNSLGTSYQPPEGQSMEARILFTIS